MILAGRAVIVTGGGQGIGRAIVHRFVREGARVVIADIDVDAARAVERAIVSAGGEALALRVDIANPDDVATMIGETQRAFDALDILVNNAGIALNVPVLDTTLDAWERQLRVNLTGTFLCAQAAARAMIARGGGRIVNVGSISGQRGAQGRAAYGASKAAVMHLTRTMAVELAPHGVAVNAVAPGPVDTEQSRATHTPATRRAYHERMPIGRYGTLDEIAAAVLFLASSDASFVVGHVLNVDGGFGAAGLMFDDDAPHR